MNDEEALKYLSPMCDIILSNSRDIRIRADDTVYGILQKQALYDQKVERIFSASNSSEE